MSTTDAMTNSPSLETLNQPKKTFKDLLKFLLKASLVAGLLYFLAQKGLLSIAETKKAFSQVQNIVPAFASLFACTFLGVLRWQWLLEAQGFHLSFRRTFQLSFIGNFFNITLPGAVSGDFVKAYYVSKEVNERPSVVFGSILFDRLAGLSALVCLSASALLIALDSLWGSALLTGIQLIVLVSAVVTIVFYAYLFLLNENHDPLYLILNRLSEKAKIIGSILRIYESVRNFRKHRGIVTKVLLISIAIWVLVCYSSYQFSLALGQSNLSFMLTTIVVPLGLLAAAVPLMPAGIGTGHAAFAYLFGLLGSQRGADVFTLYAIFQLTIGAIGGVIYLRFRSHVPIDLNPNND